MRFLFFISFFFIFSCSNLDEVKQEHSKSELTVLSEAISKTPKDTELLEKRAVYFLNKKNLESALMDYKECVRLSNDNAAYHYKLAYLYHEIVKVDRTKQNYPEKAVFHLEQALKIKPDFISALVLKGELHLAFSELKEAISCLNQAIELNYNTPKAHLLKGYIYSSLEEDRAIQFFHNTIDIDPTQEDAYVQLGLIYHKRKDSTAILYYNNTLKVNPKNKLALYNLGKFYQDTEEWNEAIRSYTQLIKIYPSFADGYYNLGFVHIRLGLYDVAVNDFSQAISFNINFHEAYYSRGHCFETLGNVNRAELDYRKAIEIQPDYKNAEDALNALLIRNKKIN